MEVRNLNKSYGKNKVLDNFSHAFADGVTCLTGRSGCGKTTLLSIMAKTLLPDGGELDIPSSVSMVWQEDRLLNWLTILDNILIPSDRKDAAYALDLARRVDMERELQKRPQELSGGQKQRAAIIRALVCNFDLILMDEPFKALDEATKFLVMSEVKKELSGRQAVIVTHERDEILFFGADELRMG